MIADRALYTYVNNKWSVYIKEDDKGVWSLSMMSATKSIELVGFDLDEVLDVVEIYV